MFEAYRKIKRGPQIITLKDASLIASYLNIKNGDVVVDVGTGSGALAIHLAYHVLPDGRVITYEKREDFAKLAMENIKRLGLEKWITVKIKDATQGIDEECDAMSVDIPNPWDLNFGTLKKGGYVCVYLPTAEQVIKFRDTTDLKIIKIVEVKEREYQINPFRPINMQLDFTGFIIVAKKIT